MWEWRRPLCAERVTPLRFRFPGGRGRLSGPGRVPGVDGSYSGGGGGGDEVTGFEGHSGGDVAEQVGNGKDEVAGGALLLDNTVEPRDDGDRAAAYGVDLVRDDGADGAEGVEALAAGPLAVGLLDV